MKRFLTFFSLCFTLILTFTLVSSAVDAPNPPLNLRAIIGDNPGAVIIQFEAPQDGTRPQFFYGYMAFGNTEDLNQFKMVSKAAINQNVLSMPFGNLQNGDYSFYLTSCATDQNQILQSNPSQIVHFTLNYQQPPYIKFISQPITNAAIGKEYVYGLKVQTNIPTDCKIKYSFNVGKDGTILAPQGMTISPDGLIKWTPTQNGKFDVSVSAYTDCKLNYQPATQVFTIVVGQNNNGSYIKITSVPVQNGIVGLAYIYKVIAETNVKCPISYEFLGKLPDGCSFDNQSGTLKILVNSPQVISGGIRAFLSCDNTIQTVQQFAIKFDVGRDNNSCASIFGTAQFEDGTNVKDGKVMAWRLTEKSNVLPLYTGYIKDGNYQLQVPAGKYILEFDGPSFIHTYYTNASNIQNATQIEVVCQTKNEANVVLKPKPVPNKFTVSGSVLKQKDNTPVMAVVEFFPVEIGNPDKNANIQNFMTKTDKDGNYSITLTDEFTYKAHAYPTDKSMLRDQWYDGVESQLEADLIYLTDNTSGINFKLNELAKISNGFAGKVINEKNEGINSRVMAVMVKTNNSTDKKNLSVTIQTNQDGTFNFANLPYGDYVLLSVPADRMYVPGYFKTGAIATLKWKDATRITVSDNMATVIYEIKHKLRTGYKGIIRVDGTVTATGITLKSIDSKKSTNSLTGALVYILDENGDVSDYTFTDEKGYYMMSEIANGNNLLVVDKVGYSEYQRYLTNDNNKSLTDKADIILSQEDPTEVTETITENNMVYPNPVNSTLNLYYTANSGNTQITIYNTIGQSIGSYQTESISGQNSIQIDAGSLQVGNYYLKITNNNNIELVRFNVVR